MTKPVIWDEIDRATKSIAAYVIVHKGDRVANVTFVHPKDGAMRLRVFVHWLGQTPVKGTASGYGYDKASAAMAHAAEKLFAGMQDDDRATAFVNATIKDDGFSWDRRLRDAGFEVWQAV